MNLQLGRCCFVRSLLSRISDSNARSSPIDVDDVSPIGPHFLSVRPHFFRPNVRNRKRRGIIFGEKSSSQNRQVKLFHDFTRRICTLEAFLVQVPTIHGQKFGERRKEETCPFKFYPKERETNGTN